MPTLKQIIFASVLVCCSALDGSSTGQHQRHGSEIISDDYGGAAGERVRITAPSSVVQMHVEVYAASGEKLFDQEIRGGNVFDWHLQDGQAQRLAPGAYVCVVTAKSVSGKLTQKIGTVRVEENSVSVQPAESQQLSAPAGTNHRARGRELVLDNSRKGRAADHYRHRARRHRRTDD